MNCIKHVHEEALPGRKTCNRCKVNKKKNREKTKEAGFCPNHPKVIAAPGISLCAQCRVTYLDYKRQRPCMGSFYNFGVTPEIYDQMLTSQGGSCAIKGCGAIRNANGKKLAIDHDHVTGKIRGLLCTNHNTALGKFNDSVEQLQAAIDYLQSKKN